MKFTLSYIVSIWLICQYALLAFAKPKEPEVQKKIWDPPAEYYNFFKVPGYKPASPTSSSSSTGSLSLSISNAIPAEGCGVPTIKPVVSGLNKKRILNGDDALSGSWPWMVSLRTYNPSTQEFSGHFCGAILISADYVLTAAHCLDWFESSLNVAAVLGLYDIQSTALDNSNTYLASVVKIHENWDPSAIRNDVGLLKLERSVTFTDRISPICLPTSSDYTIVYSKKAVLTGWGRTETGSLSAFLQQGVMKILSNTEAICVNLGYDSLANYCAFDADNRKPFVNACNGDSGGPLQYWDGSKWTVYGIVSYGYARRGRCSSNYPSFYTNVPTFLDWIQTNAV